MEERKSQVRARVEFCFPQQLILSEKKAFLFCWISTDWCCFLYVNSNPFISIKQRQFSCSAQHVWVVQRKNQFNSLTVSWKFNGNFLHFFVASELKMNLGFTLHGWLLWILFIHKQFSEELYAFRVTRKQKWF